MVQRPHRRRQGARVRAPRPRVPPKSTSSSSAVRARWAKMIPRALADARRARAHARRALHAGGCGRAGAGAQAAPRPAPPATAAAANAEVTVVMDGRRRRFSMARGTARRSSTPRRRGPRPAVLVPRRRLLHLPRQARLAAAPKWSTTSRSRIGRSRRAIFSAARRGRRVPRSRSVTTNDAPDELPDDPVRGRRTGVARLTLNRPERLNSFNGAMHAEVRDALGRVAADGARVLVLTGAGRGILRRPGPRRSAGRGRTVPRADLGESIERNYKPLVLALRALPLPTIAAVNGVAAGAGASIALACDLVVARDSAIVHPGLQQAGTGAGLRARPGSCRGSSAMRAPSASRCSASGWPRRTGGGVGPHLAMRGRRRVRGIRRRGSRARWPRRRRGASCARARRWTRPRRRRSPGSSTWSATSSASSAIRTTMRKALPRSPRSARRASRDDRGA